MERRKLVRDRLTYPIQGISVILALIYLSPFVSSLLNYAAFLMCMYRLMKYDERVFSVDYCCLISVATVFALPGGFSLVVVLSLLAEFWFVVRDGAVLDSAMAVLFLLVCYLMLRIQSSVSGFVLCVSQLLIFHRMLSFADTQTILLDIGAFVLSVLTSSVYALVFRKTSAMTAIVGREVLAYYGSSLTRFQGLFRDPNYYMSLVIMAIVLLTLLYFKKYISKALFSAGIVCMFFFGALTYSKTFLFLICLYWGLCFFYLLRARRYIFAAAFSVGTVVLAIILFIGMFFVLPIGLESLIKMALPEQDLVVNLLGGVIRICVFLGYILAVSQLKEIRRVFQYHGAEHKTIHCYEHGLELTPENARSFPRLHVRCGTAFLIMVMIIAILVYTIIPLNLLIEGWGISGPAAFALLIVVRIALMPLIAGISYEITVKWAGSHPENPLVRIVLWPGMQMQRLTTNEPDDSMLECAIEAMRLVLDREKEELQNATN